MVVAASAVMELVLALALQKQEKLLGKGRDGGRER